MSPPTRQTHAFAETWNKLIVFSQEEYEQIVLLDGDIPVRRNMDELVEMRCRWMTEKSLENGNGEGQARWVSAAARSPQTAPIQLNTTHQKHPTQPHLPPGSGVGMLDSGVLVLTPSNKIYAQTTTGLQDTARIERYGSPDWELLSEVFCWAVGCAAVYL
ncbi:hypothetical protein N7522_004739 [Penicillium canescens]|nr:hypothetical protein N7522_004739 [Penicillium canescens]